MTVCTHMFSIAALTFAALGNILAESNRKYIQEIWQFDSTDLAVVGGRVHLNFGMSYVSAPPFLNP